MALVPVAGAFGPGAPCGFALPEAGADDAFVVGVALVAPAVGFVVGAALTATVAVGPGVPVGPGATLPPGGSPVRVGAPLEGNGMGSGSGSGWAVRAFTTTLPTTRITRSAASSAPHTTYEVRLEL